MVYCRQHHLIYRVQQATEAQQGKNRITVKGRLWSDYRAKKHIKHYETCLNYKMRTWVGLLLLVRAFNRVEKAVNQQNHFTLETRVSQIYFQT